MSINFNKLPSLVTETILRHTVLQSYDKQYEWKNSLRLLKVCQGWRKVAKRLVYNNVFFVCSEEYSNTSSKMLQYKDAPIQSNIDLILNTDSSRFAKKLQILIVPNKENFKMLLDLIHQLLNFKNFSNWRNVSSLSLCCFSSTNNTDDSGIIQQEFIRLSNNLVNSMPAVKKLYLRKNSNDSITALAFNQLAKRYSENLRYLYCNSMLTLPKNCRFDSLTHLHLCLESGYSQATIPNITVERLQHLTLLNVPGNFSWNAFTKKANAVFSSLEFLNITLDLHGIITGNGIDQHMAEKNPPLSVSFPKLKVLNIIGDCLENPGIVVQRYPKRLLQLKLQVSSTSLCMLSSWGFELIDDLVVTIYGEEDGEDMFYRATNYFFGPKLISNKSSLNLGDYSFTLDPNRAEWCNISNITFTSTTSYATMTRIISQISNLTSIVVWSLDTNDSNVSTTDIADQHNIQSLNNSVERLSILDFPSLSNKEQISQSILVLLLQLPGLRRLSTGKFVVNAIKDYQAEHKQIQELGRINFIVNNFIR